MKFNLINFCEFDKYAIKSYCDIHGEDAAKNLGDITKVDIEKMPVCDLITHGSPCQDFSISGKQLGGDNESGTRSSLMWNSVEIIKHCKPKFVIWENVKNVLSPKHKHNFDKYIDTLEQIGYESHYQVLNAKYYGIPQNRERIFVVSIRKDIWKGFIFPPTTTNYTINAPKQIGFFLDEKIDAKYYLSEKQINYVLDMNEVQKGTSWEGRTDNALLNRHIAQAISCRGAASQRAGVTNFIANGYGMNVPVKQVKADIRSGKRVEIRRFTPRECFKLMGFSGEDFDKIQGISDSQLYKQAGNSIVVDVAYYIFQRLQKMYADEFEDLDYISLFSGIGAFEKALEWIE